MPIGLKWPASFAACASLLTAFSFGAAASAQTARPWMDSSKSPDERAALLARQLTDEERLQLTSGFIAWPTLMPKGYAPDDYKPMAGYVPGVPRLGIPAQIESDGPLGVTNPLNFRPGDTATALPSGLALASSFDPKLATEGGKLIGNEANAKGINVQLAGGVNLTRDPRAGRNFEYLGEDPLLAGSMAGSLISGIQSQHVISTIKHFSLNGQETHRKLANSVIDEAAHRESDLLAFEIAIERGHPGSVMCGYNLVNGAYACGNDHLLNTVLKRDWGFKGYVMSDWGAVHATDFALKGLDQQSGRQLDAKPWLGSELAVAVTKGDIPKTRLNDMVQRQLRSMFAVGLFDTNPSSPSVDKEAHLELAKSLATNGIVLLKNAGSILPIAASVKSILVVGGHADIGVLAGGGSSMVTADKNQFTVPTGQGPAAFFLSENYDPSSPLRMLRSLNPQARIQFETGDYHDDVALKAKAFDLVIIFATQFQAEDQDVPSLNLPNGQNDLIAGVAAANPHTIVVLETGGPVLMPWLDKVPAVLEAWYSGSRGGDAIAEVLTGAADPGGRLPLTFPASISQYPRAEAIPGSDPKQTKVFDVVYSEGANVGYRGFAKSAQKPLFPFGFGLSYTTFAYSDLKVTGGDTLAFSFKVTNTGPKAGSDAPQIYLERAPFGISKRLIGFAKVELQPNETREVKLVADPRLLANFDATANDWTVEAGDYSVSLDHDSNEPALEATARMSGRTIKP